MAGRIAILLCDHYRREAESVLALDGFEEAVVITFPARCNRQPLSPEELEAILAALGDCERIEIFGAACCLFNIEDAPDKRPPWTPFFRRRMRPSTRRRNRGETAL